MSSPDPQDPKKPKFPSPVPKPAPEDFTSFTLELSDPKGYAEIPELQTEAEATLFRINLDPDPLSNPAISPDTDAKSTSRAGLSASLASMIRTPQAVVPPPRITETVASPPGRTEFNELPRIEEISSSIELMHPPADVLPPAPSRSRSPNANGEQAAIDLSAPLPELAALATHIISQTQSETTHTAIMPSPAARASTPDRLPLPPRASVPAPVRELPPNDFSGEDTERTDPGITLPPLPTPPSRQTPPKAPPKALSQAQAPTAALKPSSFPKPAPNTAQPALSRSETRITLETLAPARSALPAARMPDMGPLDQLMKDPTITEIMINDLRKVIIEKDGKLMVSNFSFQTIDDLNRLIRGILDATGKAITPEQPYLDIMLPDGSRANIVCPPLTVTGPSITIRKFPVKKLGMDELIKLEMLDRRMGYFLNACILGRMNLVISGGAGGGKTTLLNALAGLIPKTERLITIEDTPELVIPHLNSVRMQIKPATPSSPAINARELVANALRMRPDRILVGECRRGEAFDMLQAMNTGHSGSMTSLHANSARDALIRLETLCMMSEINLPVQAIRKQIVSAVDLVLHVRRFRNGKRRLIAITEVTGIEGETITLQDIFLFETDIKAGSAQDSGIFKCTGFVPTFLERLREQGFELPRNYFG